MSNITPIELLNRIELAILRAGEGLSSLVLSLDSQNHYDDCDSIDIDEINNGIRCALMDTRTLRRRHLPDKDNVHHDDWYDKEVIR